MRKAIFVVLIAVVGCAIWQQHHLAELRATETALLGQAAQLVPKAHSAKPETLPDGDSKLGLSDEELAKFTVEVLKFRDLRKAGKYDLAVSQIGSLYEPLRRLSSVQLATVFDAWTGGVPITDESMENASDLDLFVTQVAGQNPGAILEFLCGHSYASEDLLGVVQTALASLFRQSPDQLLAWAQAQRFPPATEKLCAAWADASLVALEPSSENIQRFLAHCTAGPKPPGSDAPGPIVSLSYFQNRMRNEIALKLSSQEARLEFFRALREVEGNAGKEMQAFIVPLMKRVSFAQLAQIADAVAEPSAESPNGPAASTSPNGLRFQVARNSRDGTPSDRWIWLTQREADRPSGPKLQNLVGHWCEDNYPATAELVRSLPTGTERKAMEDAVVEFLTTNEGEELAAEWTGR